MSLQFAICVSVILSTVSALVVAPNNYICFNVSIDGYSTCRGSTNILVGKVGTHYALITSITDTIVSTLNWDTTIHYVPGTLSAPIPCGAHPYQECYTENICTQIAPEANCSSITYTNKKVGVIYTCGRWGVCDSTHTAKYSLNMTTELSLTENYPELSIDLSHDYNGILIGYSPTFTSYLSIIRGSFSFSSMINGTSIYVPYPKWAEAISAYVYVQVVSGNVSLYNTDWWEPARDTCDILGGFICCDRDYYTCWVLYSPYWWVTLLVIMIVLVFFLCPVAWAFTYATVVLLISPIIWVMRYTGSKLRKSRPKPVLLLLLSLSGALACTNSSVIVMSSPSCTSTTTNGLASSTCSIQLVADVYLPYVGSEVCNIITDDKGRYYGKLNIKFIVSNVVVDLSRDYYTGFYDLESESRKRCYSAGNCVSDKCATILANNSNAWGELTNVMVTQYPGITMCQSSCGCAGCGCFFCRDGCLFSRYSVIPKNTTVFSVNQVRYLTYEPRLHILLEDESENVIMNEDVNILLQDVNAGSFRINLLSQQKTTMTVFGDNKFIIDMDTNQVWYGTASQTNNPRIGFVGDLQSNTLKYYSDTQPNSYIFDWLGVQWTTSQNNVRYLYSSNGANLIHAYPTLPITIGSMYLRYQGGLITGIDNNPGTMWVRLSTLAPVTLTTIITSACPVVETVNSSGCCNCGYPARTYLRAWSTCGPSAVPVSASDQSIRIVTPSVDLKATHDIVYVDYLTARKDVSFNLNIGGVLILIKFTAVEPENVDLDQTTIYTSEEEDTTTESVPSLNFIGNWLNSNSWFTWLLDVLFCIVGVMAVLLLFYLIFKIIQCLFYTKYKKL